LKVRSGQYDDNLILNQMGLIVDRSVSMLFGPGVQISLEDESSQEYIDSLLDANKKDLFLHTLGLYGSTYGTGYVKIVPNGITDKFTGAIYDRLVVMNPELVTMEADPADLEKILMYVVEWSEGEDRWREITRRTREDDTGMEADTWVVEYWRSSRGQPPTLERVEPWPYDFAPILSVKNLPSINSQYGQSDVEQVMVPQDKLNFVNSNIGKIIRYHAHPKTIGTGVSPKALADAKVSVGADDFFAIASTEAKVNNLEMQSDLASSRAFSLDIQREIDNISRTVDTSSLADKVGALTNFGLRVLYSDTLAKTDTKRLLYGELITELVRCLLVLGGKQPEKPALTWGEALPANDVEKAKLILEDLEAGLISKETAYELRGYDEFRDWEEEQDRMQNQQVAGDNMGAMILRAFERGEEGGGMIQQQPAQLRAPVEMEQEEVNAR